MRATTICAGLLLLLSSVPAFAQASGGEDPAVEPVPVEKPAEAPEPAPAEKPAEAPEPAPAEKPAEAAKPALAAKPKPRPAEEPEPAAKAEPVSDILWSGLGGRVLPSGDDALRAWVGFPGVGAAFVTPLTRKFQLGPYFQFNYGTALGIAAPVLGVDLGAELKYQFYDKGNLALAFVAEPAFRFHFDDSYKDDFGFGMRFGPRIEGTYSATRTLNVLFKGGLPFEMTFHSTFVFYLPIAFGAGVEFKVDDDVNLYFTSEIGPLVWAMENFSDIDIWYRGEMGCSYRF